MREAKQMQGSDGRAWQKSGMKVHRQLYVEKKQCVITLIKTAKRKYFNQPIDDRKGDTKNLFRVANKLLGRNTASPLPFGGPKEVAELFGDYFIDKIGKR